MCTKGHGSVTGDRCAYGKEVYEPRFTYLLRGIVVWITDTFCWFSVPSDLYTCKGGAEEIYEPRFTYPLRGIFILITDDFSVGCLYQQVTAGQVSFLLEQVPWFSIRAG